MGYFLVYGIAMLGCLYVCAACWNIDRRLLSIAFGVKCIFVFIISYTSLKEYSFLNVPDEDNYFHDALLFQKLAKEYPLYYLQWWMDIEPDNADVFSRYFTQTDAFYKAPEFFYNDNRWVVKIHSVLTFFSGGHLAVHRLFSSFFGVLGLLWLFVFLQNVFLFESKRSGWVFLIASLFPSFFFFTSFVLKESLLIFFIGILAHILYRWIVGRRWTVFNVLGGLFMIFLSFCFRPAYLFSFVMLTSVFLLIHTLIAYQKKFVFLGSLLGIAGISWWVFQSVWHKSIIEIIQHRQERFLDASKGGIYLLNDKKFVRVPYNWHYLDVDSIPSVPVVRIKKNVPLMYWYLTNLNDTIIENNKDTMETFRVLYSVEKAERTVFIQPLKKEQSLFYNAQSLWQALRVFFLYPNVIGSFMDMVIWFENILLMFFLLFLMWECIRGFGYLPLLYVCVYVWFIILIVAVTSPNTGAILRYRYFLLPMLFMTFVCTQWYKERKRL